MDLSRGWDLCYLLGSIPYIGAVVLLKNLLVDNTHEIHERDGRAGMAHGTTLFTQAGPDSISPTAEAAELRCHLKTPFFMCATAYHPRSHLSPLFFAGLLSTLLAFWEGILPVDPRSKKQTFSSLLAVVQGTLQLTVLVLEQ